MRRAPALAPAEFQPLWQMNTTPLIDVLLVLLIMFILTIPAQTHKVDIDLPRTGPIVSAMPEAHRLTILADGSLRWNGAALSDSALAPRLHALTGNPNALLQLEAAGEARYARFDQVLAEVKRSGIARLGFVGNERFRL